ncbi:MAG: flavin monoamine oxidase family protein [Acidobacteriota bacterium]
MQTTVAIVGGGLAGLYAGRLLHAARIDFRLMEARERLGGRVLSVDSSGAPAEDGFDLGPSWFWPEAQPQVAALVRDLGVATFPQYSEGDVVFHRMSRETPWRYRATHQEPQSMRIAGGTGALIQALAKDLPGSSVLLNAQVKRMTLRSNHVELATAGPDGWEDAIFADHVIAAVPPRLLARISFSPAMDPSVEELWMETPTWMAPHAKFLAIYDRPFWRDAGLSGSAQSLVGPLAEIHDATTASGRAALFGFPGIPADARASLGSAALTKACLEQLAHLFGPEARDPRATLFKDWAADPLTATAADRSAGGHPSPSAKPWVTGEWRKLLSLAGSETSAIEPGYLAGAVSAAERAVSEVMQRLHAQS